MPYQVFATYWVFGDPRTDTPEGEYADVIENADGVPVEIVSAVYSGDNAGKRVCGCGERTADAYRVRCSRLRDLETKHT